MTDDISKVVARLEPRLTHEEFGLDSGTTVLKADLRAMLDAWTNERQENLWHLTQLVQLLNGPDAGYRYLVLDALSASKVWTSDIMSVLRFVIDHDTTPSLRTTALEMTNEYASHVVVEGESILPADKCYAKQGGCDCRGCWERWYKWNLEHQDRQALRERRASRWRALAEARREQARRLERELHAVYEALAVEKAAHAETKGLLKSALKSKATGEATEALRAELGLCLCDPETPGVFECKIGCECKCHGLFVQIWDLKDQLYKARLPGAKKWEQMAQAARSAKGSLKYAVLQQVKYDYLLAATCVLKFSALEVLQLRLALGL